jgi:pimeloyl-ACP methyl ester carboxylesterase
MVEGGKNKRYYRRVETRVINIKGISTVILITGQGSVLLCLHGWGASHESFTELCEALRDDPVQIIAPDLPGFGGSGEPPSAWSVDEYADFVEELMSALNLHEVRLLGHSFGGRIAIKLAARADTRISHLYLCAAAGIRHRRDWKRGIGHAFSAFGKMMRKIPGVTLIEKPVRTLFYKLLRSHDYEQASPRMKETMIRVINEDLSPLLSQIAVSTDLFWGEEDTMTPIRDGKLMHQNITGSVLHTFAGVRHRVHRDRAAEIASVIREQL